MLIEDTMWPKCRSVGIGMRSHTGVGGKMFQVLSNEGVNIKDITTSEIKILCADRPQILWSWAVQALA